MAIRRCRCREENPGGRRRSRPGSRPLSSRRGRGTGSAWWNRRDNWAAWSGRPGVPPMKWDILSLIPALAAEAEALGVKIRTNCRVEPDRIAPGAYDLVVLATGQEPFFPCLWENDGSLRRRQRSRS